jgi:acetolactate synthase-1/2/3 large subunit
MLGTGMIGQKNKENLELLKKSFCIPIVTGWNALELIETDHPNYVGRPGTVGDRTGNFAVQNADFLLILGCRLNIRQVSYNWSSFAKNAYKVMVDIDDAELNKATLKIDLKVNAYLNEFLDCFLSKKHYFEEAKSKAYLEWLKELSKKYPVSTEVTKLSDRINPYEFLKKLTAILPEGAVVISGNGSACVMTYQVAIVKKNQRYVTNSGCASMGYDLPAAIGAALINSDAPCIICLAGDGSVMMNLQELQTIKTYNLPIKIFILSNGGYLSIKQTQTAYFSDNIFGTGCNDGLDLPDFVKVGESFGISSQTISMLEDLDNKIFVDDLYSKETKIYNVKLDPDIGFSPKLSSRKNIDGSMTSPELEDMAPFLSKEELAQNVYKN